MPNLIDDTDFPVVSFDTDKIATPGDFDAFVAAWNSLQGRGEPYVTIALGTHKEDDQPAMQRSRAMFFKLYGKSLATHCMGLLVVVEDERERERLTEQAVNASKAFNLPIEYFPDRKRAWDRAWELVEQRPIPDGARG